MNVIICTLTLCNGGAERVASLWANGFAQRGEDVKMVILKDIDGKITYPLDSRVTVVNISSKSRNKYLNMLQVSHQLRKLVRASKAATVISVICPIQVLYSTLFTKSVRINTEHESFERPKNVDNRVYRFYKFIFNRFFDRVTVITKRDVELTEKKLSNVHYLPNPLALQPVQVIPQKNNIVLAVGRLDAWYCKGFDILIEAWGKVCDKFQDWKLEIVGGGTVDDFKTIENFAAANHCKSSVVVSPYTENILEKYNNSAVFVLSSRYEGFGLVLIEAMSQGCACIACDYNGRQKEIFSDDSCGILCSTEDSNALAIKITQMLSDSEKRSYYASNAIERSKDFGLDAIMEKWYTLLKLK